MTPKLNKTGYSTSLQKINIKQLTLDTSNTLMAKWWINSRFGRNFSSMFIFFCQIFIPIIPFYFLKFQNYGLAIIVSSDSLMVECEKLLYSAHHYQSQTLKMSLLSVELKRFIAKLKHFKPIISAADFFEIRRPSILSMISGITTNSIIMIQLGDAKFEKNLEVRQRL